MDHLVHPCFRFSAISQLCPKWTPCATFPGAGWVWFQSPPSPRALVTARPPTSAFLVEGVSPLLGRLSPDRQARGPCAPQMLTGGLGGLPVQTLCSFFNGSLLSSPYYRIVGVLCMLDTNVFQVSRLILKNPLLQSGGKEK